MLSAHHPVEVPAVGAFEFVLAAALHGRIFAAALPIGELTRPAISIDGVGPRGLDLALGGRGRRGAEVEPVDIDDPLREPLVELVVRGRELAHECLGPRPFGNDDDQAAAVGILLQPGRWSVSRWRVLKSSNSALRAPVS